MKGTEKIIAHIRADAEAQAAAIIAQAEQQCAAVREDYDKQAKESYGAKIRAGVKACEDRVSGMERIAQMEARKGVLALKQEMVSASFDKACEMVVALPQAQYIELPTPPLPATRSWCSTPETRPLWATLWSRPQTPGWRPGASRPG